MNKAPIFKHEHCKGGDVGGRDILQQNRRTRLYFAAIMTVGKLRRFRAAQVGPSQGFPELRRLRRKRGPTIRVGMKKMYLEVISFSFFLRSFPPVSKCVIVARVGDSRMDAAGVLFLLISRIFLRNKCIFLCNKCLSLLGFAYRFEQRL